MSATYQVTIWCDDCSVWDQATCPGPRTLRKELRAKGWSYSPWANKDRCPKCTELAAAAKAAAGGK